MRLKRFRQKSRKRVLDEPEYHRAQLVWTICVGVAVAMAALFQATRNTPRHALFEETASVSDSLAPKHRLRSAASDEKPVLQP